MDMLRDYQAAAVKQIVADLRRGRSPLFVLPTGGGKTETAIGVIKDAAVQRVLWLTPRSDLMEQTAKRLQRHGVTARALTDGKGREWPGAKPKQRGQGATTETWPTGIAALVTTPAMAKWRLYERQLGRGGLVIIDEAHHAATQDGTHEAGEWAEAALRGAAASMMFGMTATPVRLDRKMGFARTFTNIIAGPSYAELAAAGFLSPMRILKPPPEFLIRGGKTLGGEYKVSDVMKINERRLLIDEPAAWLENATADTGLRSIVFCVVQSHGLEYALELMRRGRLNGVGLTLSGAEYLERAHGEGLPVGPEAIAAFRTGDLQCLVNVAMVIEGFDAPQADCVQVLRPTMSKALWAQFCGRASRPSKAGEALILDAPDNARLLGDPSRFRADDWSLLSARQRARDASDERLRERMAVVKHENLTLITENEAVRAELDRKDERLGHGGDGEGRKRRAAERIAEAAKKPGRRQPGGGWDSDPYAALPHSAQLDTEALLAGAKQADTAGQANEQRT